MFKEHNKKMERIANDALKSFDRHGPASDEQIHYPWPEHDIKKGEITEEFEALKRAVQGRRCATTTTTAAATTHNRSSSQLHPIPSLKVDFATKCAFVACACSTLSVPIEPFLRG